MNFKELHQQKAPLLLCNVWDVPSAKVAERLKFQAIATSSGAIASMLGYEDGEQMSFTELLYIVRRISHNVKLPLSVDLETGYSKDPERVATYIEQLVNSGVVGVNIEDSILGKERRLGESFEFANFLKAIRSALKRKDIDLFINVRTDSFLLGIENALEETLVRIEKYTNAGADGIFIPFIVEENDIKAVVEASSIPVNVIAMSNLPSLAALEEIGVKRISMGGFVQRSIYTHLEKELEGIRNSGGFKNIFKS